MVAVAHLKADIPLPPLTLICRNRFIACGRSTHSMISTFEEVAVGKKPLDKEIQE